MHERNRIGFFLPEPLAHDESDSHDLSHQELPRSLADRLYVRGESHRVTLKHRQRHSEYRTPCAVAPTSCIANSYSFVVPDDIPGDGAEADARSNLLREMIDERAITLDDATRVRRTFSRISLIGQRSLADEIRMRPIESLNEAARELSLPP